MSVVAQLTFAGALSRDIAPRTLYLALTNGDVEFINSFAETTVPDADEVMTIKRALEEFASMLNKRREGRHSKLVSQYWNVWDRFINAGWVPTNDAEAVRATNPLFRATVLCDALAKYGLEDWDAKPVTYNLPVSTEVQSSAVPDTKFDSERGKDAATARWTPGRDEEARLQDAIRSSPFFINKLQNMEMFGFGPRENYTTVVLDTLKELLLGTVSKGQLDAIRRREIAGLYLNHFKYQHLKSWAGIKKAAQKVFEDEGDIGVKLIAAANTRIK